jgi:hypothetical protein
VGLVAVLTQGTSKAVPASPSGFESGDGNMVLDATNMTDWNCFQGSPGFQASANYGNNFGKGDCHVTTGATQTWADGGTTSVGTSEFQFKSGTKFDDPCVTINTGSNPPKDEWTNIAEFTEAAANKDLYFYGASIRPKVNGNTSGNVYFSQTTNGCHTVGDILLGFNFLNGGGTPSLHALEWLASGSPLPCFLGSSTPPCWGNDQSINGAFFDGNVNTTQINAADNAINGQTIAANAFAEFGINLTGALHNLNITNIPCFANQTWVSRSSGSSFSSNPEDVEVVSRPTCGNITIIKHTLNGAGTRSGVNQDFTYTSTGLSPSVPTLNDAAATDTPCPVAAPGTCNEQQYQNLTIGQYSVTENAEPANFKFVSLNCTNKGTLDNSVVSGETANITLAASDNWVCTYVNQQQLGAIKITKTGKDKNCTAANKPTISNGVCTGAATAALSGGVFSIKDSGGNAVPGSPATTGSDGTACVGNLPFGTYSVQETGAPNGYAIDDLTAHNVTVSANSTCGDGNEATFSASDTPLTNLTAHTQSVVAGATNSTITCVDATSTNIGNSPQGPSDPATVTANSLKVGTYTCTVVIDP